MLVHVSVNMRSGFQYLSFGKSHDRSNRKRDLSWKIWPPRTRADSRCSASMTRRVAQMKPALVWTGRRRRMNCR